MNVPRIALVLTALALACDSAPPPPEPGPDERYVDAADCPSGPPAYVENLSGCSADPLDYLPRVNGSATDQWAACITDASPDDYPRIDPNVSTIARTAAFEEIATKLWEDRVVPSKQDFVDARVAYAVDQGIDSRVQRREDYHYPKASAACSTVGVPETAPDRCVGPAKLLPILNDAFARGVRRRNRIQAARIEAALTWFFYISTYSEVNSCIGTPNNCDSAWAYYTGGTSRGTPSASPGASRPSGRGRTTVGSTPRWPRAAGETWTRRSRRRSSTSRPGPPRSTTGRCSAGWRSSPGRSSPS
jgi:hypothetical protein